MSLVAMGRHYLRSGTGTERLYDLSRDPYEMVDLAGTPDGDQVVGDFRKRLLKMLDEAPGAPQPERAYLKPFRRWLEVLVGDAPAPHGPAPAPRG